MDTANNSTDTIKIYTDGACSMNPGPGGWAAILLWRKSRKEIKGFVPHTTNNKMELTAVIEALKTIKNKQPIEVYTDSQYVKNGITIWIHKWRTNGWNNGKVKNVDLWHQLSDLSKNFKITWHWVKGHSGNLYNEQVDKLARSAIEENSN